MVYIIWLVGGLALGVLVRDIRKAVSLMVLVVLVVVVAAVLLGHRTYPLAQSGGLLLLPLAGILATVAGHRLRRAIWGFFTN